MIFDEKYFDFENGEVKIKPFQFTQAQSKSHLDSFSWASALAGAKSAPMLSSSGISSFLLPLLSTAGFGPTGILPQSLASYYQNTVGNIPPNTFFPLLQSIGAKEAFAVAGVKAGGVVAAVDSYFRNSK
ncbi:Oidioi.mRNA.OKI2018_I69.PAR.g11008.t1.cds [Oikopleura dioica]|uniref:Oidioi.mRNA.OKI2018_I69.PAR.g11008.t1.cds n=1 Tax=Oikopleura dioica TaxID=34765 RepID=A0ABN7RWR5_OIKDI|nr:Oidioi.mRNA.OKI2018_I69.PAR.g11008.t1.cds [Oikopleura dioica]